MADIELLIKIPEEDYKKISNSNPSYADDFNLYYAIKNGTPLPKGHGEYKTEKNCETCKHYGVFSLECGRCDNDMTNYAPK